MYVVSGLRADLCQQRSVHPVHDRSVHFTRSTKHSAVVFEFGDENILNLQISTRMKQWNGVQKAFDGARTELKPLIHNAFADELFQQPALDYVRQRCIKNALDGDESFFQSHRVPYVPPERDAFF